MNHAVTTSPSPFHTLIADLVPAGSRVLDLGCGDGSLLAHLMRAKGCTGYGIELDDANVQACIGKGLPVLQLNLEDGLALFADNSFDVVLQINTLQHLRNAQTMLRETVRVGRQGIIAFPNFAYWRNRASIMQGRMPVNKRLPYEWYNTPNIRVGTFADFGRLANKNGLRVLGSFGVHENQATRTLPNLLATTAVYRVTKP